MPKFLKCCPIRSLEFLLLLPLCYLLYEQQQAYMGYVKDDTFISMRYARNFAEGHGLVFNYGQKLEGYTNFLWVMLTAPAFWLKVDPLSWVKAMACLFGQAGIFVTYAIGRHFAGGRLDPFAWLGAAAWAFSASVVLWSTAGLEPTLMAVLCSGGTLLAMQLASAEAGDPSNRRRAVLAGVVLALAGLGRPDAHAVVLIAAAAGVLDWLRNRDKFGDWLRCALVIAGILGPYHLIRILYFGDMLPNTFYIKAAAGPEVWKQGRDFVGGLLGFTTNPYAFGLAALGLLFTAGAALGGWARRGPTAEPGLGTAGEADGSDDSEAEAEAVAGDSSVGSPKTQAQLGFNKLWAAALCLFFLAYMVKIGRDEMKWYRLYLPVFPLLLALAGDGLRWLAWCGGFLFARDAWNAPGRVGRRRRAWVFAPWIPIALVLGVGLYQGNDELLDQKAAWHNRYVESSEKTFQAMGRYISERSKPGTVVLFQDMGGAPFAGGDLRWIDTIGILNRRVAREHSEIGLNPFMRGIKRSTPGGGKEIQAMDARLRDYFFEQDPQWIAMVAYVGKGGGKRGKIRRNFKRAGSNKKKQAKLFSSRVKRNSHAHGIAKDPRFTKNFSYEKAWMRNRGGYWLVLYKRRAPSPGPASDTPSP